VELIDHRGRPIGWGLYSPASDIMVRVLSWGEAPPPTDWLRRRLAAALAARAPLGLEAHGTTGYREVNSEGDRLPGLVIDRYGDDRVVQVATPAMAAHEGEIVGFLRERGCHHPHVMVSERAADLEALDATPRRSAGGEVLRYLEFGLALEVPAPPSQKTGAYLDQRRNRRIVAQLAARHGGGLLELGCHAGGFSLHAARFGVRCVGVDRSRSVLARASDNAARNDLGALVEWVEADMFGELDDPRADGPFGTVVVDPPRLANSPRDRDRALAALERLVRQSMARLAPFGHLVLCSCSHHVRRVDLDAVVTRSGGDGWTRTLELGPGPDHPVWPGHLEGDYLRVAIYQRRPD
jgi:23S rRNA (cytosine1962-C5)-methyltransferase